MYKDNPKFIVKEKEEESKEENKATKVNTAKNIKDNNSGIVNN